MRTREKKEVAVGVSFRRESGREQGFTIMELLLGLAIFAVMAASVYLTYTNALRIDGESRHRSELAREAVWTLAALEEDLQNMVDYRYFDRGKAEEQPAFVGGPASLALVVEQPDGLKWVSYALREPEAGTVRQSQMGRRVNKNLDQTVTEQRVTDRQQTFIRSLVNFMGRPPVDTTAIPSEILTKKVPGQGLRFFYAKKAASGGSTALIWEQQWRAKFPPVAVRIALRLEDEQGGAPLEMEKDVWLPAGGEE